MQSCVNRQNLVDEVWVAHGDINSYYNPASSRCAGLLTDLYRSRSWGSPPGGVSGSRWNSSIQLSSQAVTVPSSPRIPLWRTGSCCDVGVTQTQSPQGGACCETSAEVSGEIQLCSGQSLIDNGLWQPTLRTTSSLLDPWFVCFFRDCQSL